MSAEYEKRMLLDKEAALAAAQAENKLADLEFLKYLDNVPCARRDEILEVMEKRGVSEGIQIAKLELDGKRSGGVGRLLGGNIVNVALVCFTIMFITWTLVVYGWRNAPIEQPVPTVRP